MFKLLFKKEIPLVLIVSFLTYTVFFYNFFNPNYYFWGSDAEKKHVPARFYLYEKITIDHTFPFWTERAFLGFPIYADFENAYLHPVNVASILLFGPLLSYKVIHLLFYFIGSLSLYFFLKRRKINFLGFVASNLIFFFSTFLINHQIHFNVILSLYLLPTSLLLTDLFIENRSIKYIFLQSLVLANCILLGHPQSLVLIYTISLIYLFVCLSRKNKLRTILAYTAITGILCFAFTAFQLIPTYELFKNSYRDDNFRYTQGSLTPQMIVFASVPYLFGDFENFAGKRIDADFSYTEVYFYMGLTTSLIALLALFTIKSKKIFAFSYIAFFVFLILSFLSSSQLFSNNFPFVSLFRYWVRSSIIVIFVAASLVAFVLGTSSNFLEINKKVITSRLKFLLLPIFYYIYMLFVSTQSRTSIEVFKYLRYNLDAYPYYTFLIFLLISTIFFLLLLFFVKNKNLILISKLALIFLLFLDLRFFAEDVLKLRLQSITSFKLPTTPTELVNKRVIPDNGFSQMEYLYSKYWTPYGYSQFIDKKYVNFLKNAGVKNERAYVESTMAITNLSRDTGVDYMLLDNTVVKIDKNSSERNVINIETPIKYLQLSEGLISFEYNLKESEKIDTFIKYDKNWKLKINGIEVPIERHNIYLSLNLPSGKNMVELEYVPNDFYLGLFISLLLFIFLCIFYIRYKNKVMLLLK